MRILILFLTTALLYACERPEDPGAATTPSGSRGVASAASYDRSFFLISRRDDVPVAAVLDFTTTDTAEVVRRTADAWLNRTGEWRQLLASSWSDEPMRDPWRLVPHGSLRMVVGEGGELDALVHRDDSTGFRLVPSAVLTEWGIGDSAQFRLRRGELRVGDESIVGTVLDLQTGAPVTHAGEPEIVFVTDGAQTQLVVARGERDSAPAWLYRGSEALNWDGVVLLPFESDADSAAGGSAIPGWRIQEPTGGLKGEFLAAGESLTAAGASDGARTAVVRGWIQAHGGERLSVFGVIRYGR